MENLELVINDLKEGDFFKYKGSPSDTIWQVLNVYENGTIVIKTEKKVKAFNVNHRYKSSKNFNSFYGDRIVIKI